MRAFDQIVVAHEVLLTRDGVVVAQEIHRVHVAVEEIPAAVEVALRHAVADDSCGVTFSPARFQSPARQMESFPQVLCP